MDASLLELPALLEERRVDPFRMQRRTSYTTIRFSPVPFPENQNFFSSFFWRRVDNNNFLPPQIRCQTSAKSSISPKLCPRLGHSLVGHGQLSLWNPPFSPLLFRSIFLEGWLMRQRRNGSIQGPDRVEGITFPVRKSVRHFSRWPFFGQW
jgi:hypothetical protein